MKFRNLLYLMLPVIFLFSACGKKEKDKPAATYRKGELTILTDESFKSVIEALADGYMISYPDTDIKVKVQKEDLGFLDLLQNKAKIAVMSRELTDQEKEEFKTQIDTEAKPAWFAVDAVVFVTAKNSARNSISIKEIEDGLLSENKPFIFDGTNSSNLNFVAQKLNRKASELKFSVISGNENVAEQIQKYPDKIGVISLNTISRPYGKEAERLRNMVKILPVEDKGVSYNPDYKGLGSMNYPFVRTLYFLTNEKSFNIANGFIRYACTHMGQMIVQKEGLQKYYLFQREVQMN